jgi:hypothetical protein
VTHVVDPGGTFLSGVMVGCGVNTEPGKTDDPLEALANAEETREESDLPALTVFDRCDSPDCSSQAYVRARLRNGLQLVFCGHHGHDLTPALVGQGAVIRDDSHLLVENRLRSTSG